MSMSLTSVSLGHSVRLALTALLGLFAAGALAPSAAQAQDASSMPPEERPLLEQVRALEMDSLTLGRATVHFTPGYRDRAERLAPRVDRAIQLFADSLGAELEEFHLILPDTLHWEQLAEWPYGVPVWGLGGWQARNLGRQVPGRPPSAIIPADGRGAVYEQVLTLKNCIIPEQKERLKQVGLTWEEASRRYVEAITFHEIGHGVAHAYEIGQPLWMDKFLANAFAYAYMHHHEPTSATPWDVITAVTLECQEPSHGRTLEKAERLGQDAADKHWFESFVIQRANRVVEAHGFDFFRNARKAFPPRASVPSDPLWDKVEALEKSWAQFSDEETLRRLREINDEMLRRLERIAPGFQEWARRFERAGSGGTDAQSSEPQGQGPVIDMHLHANTIGDHPVVEPLTGLRSPESTAKLREKTIEALKHHNVVLAVTSGSDELVDSYKQAAPDRIVRGCGSDESRSADTLQKQITEGECKLLAEFAPQYGGIPPNAPSLEPYFALAESLDVPLGIHVGLGPPGTPYKGSPKYRMKHSNPLLLEDVLVRHPDLRLYVMHAGWPMLDEMIGLLYAHPQVYVDLAVINWVLPREEFYRYLRRLVEAGFGDRIMYGSDQMNWPQSIGESIEAIQSAPFLSEQQKRDILYNNAARFLRLSEEEIQRHHEMVEQ